MNRPALVVRDGRQPFEVAVLVACFLIGVFGLIGPSLRSAAIDLAWGGATSAVWYGIVGAFALVGLWAVTTARVGETRRVSFRRRPPITLGRSLHVERIAMYGIAGPLAAFLPAALVSSGPAGLTAGSVFLGLAVAAGVRIRQIGVDLSKLDRLTSGGADATSVVSDPDRGDR